MGFRPRQGRFRPLARIAVILLMNLAQPASASPGAATWYRESLLGENGSHAFVLTTTMINEGSYYRSRELQNLLRIDKRTGAVVDSILIRAVVIYSDPSTSARSLREEQPPSFDLPAYLRAHGTYGSFSQDPEEQAELDSTGLYIPVGVARVVLVPMATIRARFQPSGEPDAVALLGGEFTLAVPDSGLSRMIYYRICSSPAGSDVPSSEVLIMVPHH
jgi:hypothetical protein